MGQCPCLIRADDAGTAQRFYGGQLFYYGPPGRHTLDAQGQDDGDDGWQPLRNGSYRQGYGGKKHIQHIFSLDQSHPEHDSAHRQAQEGQGFGDLPHFSLERRVALLVLQKQVGDPPHLGVHPRGHHQGGPSAGGDHGAREHHVGPVPQSGLLRQPVVGSLFHGDRFAGHGRLVRLEAAALHNSSVSGHHVPRLQQDHVPRHQGGGGYLFCPPLPQDMGLWGGHPPQLLQGLLGVVLLGDGDDSVDQNNN